MRRNDNINTSHERFLKKWKAYETNFRNINKIRNQYQARKIQKKNGMHQRNY